MGDTEVFHLPLFLNWRLPAPSSSLVQVEFGAVTHPGAVRPSNEDAYLIFKISRTWERLLTSLPWDQLPPKFEEHGYVMAVADGMGGHHAGEVASTLALRTGVALVLNAAQWALKLDHPEQGAEQIEEAIQRGLDYFRTIHQVVRDQASGDPQLARMGTTLTTSYSFGQDLFVLHVGDSRAYLFRQGKLRQLTRDHTIVAALVELGTLTPEEAARHRLRHVLTRAIGGGAGEVHAEVIHRQLAHGDILLLCSDGLTNHLSDLQITDILLRAEPASVACQTLLHQALQAGGKDNITILLARYHLPDSPDQANPVQPS